MIKRKSMLAIADINKIVEEKAQVDEMLAQTQREKDLELKKIEKKYELRIDSLLRRQKELKIIIRDGRLTKHDALRILVSYRLVELFKNLQGGENS